jgi:hypothetical protein
VSKRSEMARLRRAAEAGDLGAANELGDMLEEDGDLVSAEHWFRRTATAEDTYGALSLGIVLWDAGRPVEGAKWLKMAASSDDPENSKIAELAAAALGRNLLNRDKLDEAEPWLIIGAEAGIDAAEEDLERLRIARNGGASQGPGGDVLQTFDVDSVTFYDGSGHRLGPSTCTLTRTRLVIDDARGGITQIHLRDINGISTPGRLISPKLLRISLPGAGYDMYCQSKDQKNSLEAWLSKAIREA